MTTLKEGRAILNTEQRIRAQPWPSTIRTPKSGRQGPADRWDRHGIALHRWKGLPYRGPCRRLLQENGQPLEILGEARAFGAESGAYAGAAFFWMSGVGPILVGGPLVSSIVGALEGATVHNGLTAIGSALHSMGIPKSSVINYESALRANKFLLVVHGANGEASRANGILRKTEPIELAAHSG